MTQEEKELLLRDLCARLPYGVKFGIGSAKLGQYNLTDIDAKKEKVRYGNGLYVGLENCKPYLRPMSSMTEEEMVYIDHRFGADLNGDIDPTPSSIVELSDMVNFLTWLNKNHFDYRGLIPKGLAIAITEENNPYK